MYGWSFIGWVCLIGVSALVPLFGQTRTADPQANSAEIGLSQTLVEAIAKAEVSVVAIARGPKETSPESLVEATGVPFEWATGVIVSAEGLILTNHHVLGNIGASTYVVWHRQRPYFPVTVKAADPWIDLAVLQIPARDLVPIEFGDASQLRKGQIVVALGNPYALARQGDVCATWGIISNLSRKAVQEDWPHPSLPTVPADPPRARQTLHQYGTLIQTDARLMLGTSGGALIDLQGEMIGLTTALVSLTGIERSAGFAIPVDDTFRRAVGKLKEGEEVAYGYLGIDPEPIPPSARRHGDFGVRLRQIEPITPAAWFGLRSGDVITHIDDRPIHNSDELQREISSAAAGQTVRLALRRYDPITNGERKMVQPVTLAKKRIPAEHGQMYTTHPSAWQGLSVDFPLADGPDGAPAQGADVPGGCVAVTAVERDSPAWQVGLRIGHHISHVNGERVTQPAQFWDRVRGAQKAQLRLTTPLAGRYTVTISAAPAVTRPRNHGTQTKPADQGK